MKYIYLFPLAALLACGNDGTETSKENDTQTEDTVKAETPVEENAAVAPLQIAAEPALQEQAPSADRKLLVYFFGKTHAVELLSAMQAIGKVKTDIDLHTCFHYADSICTVASERMNDEKEGLTDFYDHIDSINKLYEKISPLLPYLEFGCEAECSMPVISVRYTAFEKLAGTTAGEQDDTYFAFMRETHGEGGHASIMSATWFDMTWDYGGNSLLGGGHHYKALKHAQDIKTNHVFIKEIEDAENLCLQDALTWGTLFYTADKAIEELKKIMRLDIGIRNKKKVEERIQKLKSPDENMQLDCEHKDCVYG